MPTLLELAGVRHWDSAEEADREAVFTVQPNEAGSSVLRWEIGGTLLPGERRALHEAYARALARRLEAMGAADFATAAELAHHWSAAGDAAVRFFSSPETILRNAAKTPPCDWPPTTAQRFSS